jgi:CelD/BcsL family acetyltransferase involved in cellulose biosynthesis
MRQPLRDDRLCSATAAPLPAYAAPVARSHGLNDEEHAAIRALQEAAPTPPVEHPVWVCLVSSSLVWIDRGVMPATVRLTPTGRSYPTD